MRLDFTNLMTCKEAKRLKLFDIKLSNTWLP